MALYPPSAVCRQLYEIHPWLRLAWHAQPTGDEGDLNAGSFAIVQLYHISDAGTPENPNTYLLHWEEHGLTRGPVFNRYGGCSRDWDPLFRMPVYIANLEEHGISKNEVSTGAFLPTIRHWLRPYRVRAEENANELHANMKRRIADIAEEKTDYLWSLANRADADRIIMPYADARIQMKAWEKEREKTQKSLAKYYRPAGL